MGSAMDRARKYNFGAYYIDIPKVGLELIYNDPESVQYVLSDRFDNFPNTPMRKLFGEEIWGDGIFMVNGESWKMERKLAKPMFSQLSLQSMVPIFNKHADILLKIFSERISSDERKVEVDIQNLFKRYTLDTIGEIGFGVQIGSLQEPIEFSYYFDWVQDEITKQFLYPGRRFFMRKEWNYAMSVLNEFVYKIIETRRKDGYEGRKDLLSMYMQSKNESPASGKENDKFYRDALMNFAIAGRDTTSILLTWAFYFISQNPEVEEKILEEIDTVLGPDELPTFESMKALRYMKCVLDETLRLYPPALPFMAKVPREDDVLPNGIKVQAGKHIVYSSYIMHRTPSLWGEDCNEFKPERWLDPNVLKHPYQYVPFQKGPRICLGMEMAYLEAKIVMTRILRKGLRLRLVPNQTLRCEPNITLYARSGTLCYVNSIHSSDV